MTILSESITVLLSFEKMPPKQDIKVIINNARNGRKYLKHISRKKNIYRKTIKKMYITILNRS